MLTILVLIIGLLQMIKYNEKEQYKMMLEFIKKMVYNINVWVY